MKTPLGVREKGRRPGQNRISLFPFGCFGFFAAKPSGGRIEPANTEEDLAAKNAKHAKVGSEVVLVGQNRISFFPFGCFGFFAAKPSGGRIEPANTEEDLAA